jgi:hypothetical protein
MRARVIALLFAAVLLWSGLNTIETPQGLAQPAAEQAQVIAHAAGLEAGHQGSVDQHHLDDRPWQAQSEPPVESPGLMPTPRGDVAPRMSAAHPRSPRCAAATSPFLEGPLRPPCSAAFAG